MACRSKTLSPTFWRLMVAMAPLCGATAADAAGMALRSPDGVVTPYVFNFKRPTILVPLVPEADLRSPTNETGAGDTRLLAVQAAQAARRKPALTAGVGSERLVPRGEPMIGEPQALAAVPRTTVQVSELEPPTQGAALWEDRGVALQPLVQVAALVEGPTESDPLVDVVIGGSGDPVEAADAERLVTKGTAEAAAGTELGAPGRPLTEAPVPMDPVPAGTDGAIAASPPDVAPALETAPLANAEPGPRAANPGGLVALGPAALVVLALLVRARRRARHRPAPSARGVAQLCEPTSCRRLVRLLSRGAEGAPAGSA